jgi:hypothetical protein
MKSIEQETIRLTQREQRADFGAKASELTWRVDVHTRLLSLAETLRESRTARHIFEGAATDSAWNGLPGFEIVGISETLYSRTSRSFLPQENVSFEQEKLASLRYEMNPDGSIAVIVTPHSSPLHKLTESHFLIDFARSSHAFTGDCGNRRLRRHISPFLFLCDASHGTSCPSPSTGSYLRKIQRKSNKYRDLYNGSYTQRRKDERDTDIALGTGLAGGLVASTLLPLARDAGSNARQRLVDLKCDGSHYIEAQCTANSFVVRDHFVSTTFTTESVLFVGLVMFVGVLVFIRRMFK